MIYGISNVVVVALFFLHFILFLLEGLPSIEPRTVLPLLIFSVLTSYILHELSHYVAGRALNLQPKIGVGGGRGIFKRFLYVKICDSAASRTRASIAALMGPSANALAVIVSGYLSRYNSTALIFGIANFLVLTSTVLVRGPTSDYNAAFLPTLVKKTSGKIRAITMNKVKIDTVLSNAIFLLVAISPLTRGLEYVWVSLVLFLAIILSTPLYGLTASVIGKLLLPRR